MFHIVIRWMLSGTLLLIGSFVSEVEAATRYTIQFRDGQVRERAEHKGYDPGKFRLEMKYGGKNHKLYLNKIATITRETRDNRYPPPIGPDTLDTVIMTDGAVHQGHFLYWTSRNFALAEPGSLTDKIKIDVTKIAGIHFGSRVLMVDRMDWISDYRDEDASKELALGAEYSGMIAEEMFLVQDPDLQAYIQQLGETLVKHSKRPDIPYRFHIVNDNVVNAFAVPGGYVYFYRGLIEMTENEAELAGVMGHEIGHIVGRHSMKQMKRQRGLGLGAMLGSIAGAVVGGAAGQLIYAGSQMTAGLVTQKYSRDHERESDFLGMYTLYQAGYDPHGMSTLFEKFGALRESQPSTFESWFESHPQSGERVANALEEEAKLPSRDAYLDRTADYQKMKDALALLPKPWEVRDNPADFLTVSEPDWNSRGNAWVRIHNHSDYMVTHVGVYIQFLNDRGEPAHRVGYLIGEDRIAPGSSISVDLGKAITSNATGGSRNVRLEVGQAIPIPMPESLRDREPLRHGR